MRRSVVLSIALLAALLWSLPAEAAQAGPGRAPAIQGPGSSSYVPPVIHDEGRVRVHFVGLLGTGKEDSGREFSARRVGDLLILVEYQSLSPGPHTQRLKLFLPDGALYQQFTSEFQGGSAQQTRGPGWERVTTRLPVAGTWITEHSLYGTWRFEVYLDQARQPTTHGTFTLHR